MSLTVKKNYEKLVHFAKFIVKIEVLYLFLDTG